jgi:hypothetical protein
MTTPLPAPAPPVWAPRLRRWLMAWLARQDRRKAREVAAHNLSTLDVQWRQTYTQWWDRGGWATGALPPEQAYAQVLRRRRPG